MLEKTRGIVIQHLKYGDSSLICHIFTRDFGRQSFIIKGVRSKKAKLRANLFQLLNILNIEFYSKENRELLLIKDVARTTAFNSFPYDAIKSTQAMFMAEVLKNCIAEGDPDPLLFDFIENSIQFFDLMETDFSNFHLAFMMKLTKYIGILPGVQRFNQQEIPDLKEDLFREPSVDLKQSSGEENSSLLYKLYKIDFQDIGSISLNRERRNFLLEDIIDFYTQNGYNLKNLKSLSVLKELFS